MMKRPQTMSLEMIDAQRELGWPDFHPEDYCHRCGGRNISWSVNSLIWNAVIRNLDGTVREDYPQSEIICQRCFVDALEEFQPKATLDLFLKSALDPELAKRISKWQAARDARTFAWLETHPDAPQ